MDPSTFMSQSKSQSQPDSKGGGIKTPDLDGKRCKVTFPGMCRQGGVENWRTVFSQFSQDTSSFNQTAQYYIRSLHALFTFFMGCWFSQQEAHLFFSQFLPQIVFFFTNNCKHLLSFFQIIFFYSNY